MRAVAIYSCWRSWSRVAVLGALAAGIAGCSADTTRFSDPNSNPFAASHGPAEYTGSVRGTSAVSSGVPTAQIAAQSLPPPPIASRPATVGATSASAGVSGGGQGLGSYTPVPVHASAPAP